MSQDSFPALLVGNSESAQITASVERISLQQLPSGDITLRVRYSSLNFKDALAIEGHPGVVKSFPHIPGVDASGEVVESHVPRFALGDKVLVTGYGLGEKFAGGFSHYARVPAESIVPLPEGLSLEESMIYGTAGFTAGLCVAALISHGVGVDAGNVVVTGASGGVGSIAVGILAKLGYRVVAVSGKPAARELLHELGAAEILHRSQVLDDSQQPLLQVQWAAAVDTVGGKTLSTILRSTAPHGCVAACGLVGGERLELTVYPFILRGVTLAGIDSVKCPMAHRRYVWNQLAGPWRFAQLYRLQTMIRLDQVVDYASRIKTGLMIGRVTVDLSD